jgi:hypothetical protein
MNIILGISGSVAAVLTEKMCDGLLPAGHGVRIVATNPSLYFLPLGISEIMSARPLSPRDLAAPKNR